MKKVSVPVLIIILLVIGCTSKKYEISENDFNNLKQVTINGDSATFLLEFYNNGNLKSLNRYTIKGERDGESLSFYENGVLNTKIKISEGIVSGNAYYFFEHHGALKSDRYFRNNKQVFYGADYWGDSMGTMKSSLHLNDSGEIFLKKNYDKNGKFINQERP